MITNTVKTFYKEIFRAIPLPVVLLSQAEMPYIITEANRSFLEFIGLSDENVIGEDIFMLLDRHAVNGQRVDYETFPVMDQAGNINSIMLTVIVLSSAVARQHDDYEHELLISAGKLAEINRLRINQECLINGTKDLIWSVDMNMQIISANKSFTDRMQTVTGLSVKEGDALLREEFGSESTIKWENYYRRSLQGEQFTVKELSAEPVSGDSIYSLITFAPMFSENGNVFGVACYSKDVTRETINQQALEKSENEMHRTMNASVDVICSINESGNFVKVNETARKIWGYDPETLVGTPFIDYVYAADHESTNRVAADILEGKEITSFQNRYVRSDGSLVPMEWSAKWDNTDKLMYCIARDVSEKQALQRAVEYEHKRYENLFIQAPAFICILKGPQHIFQMANPDYEKLIGKTNFIGRSVRELLPELDGQGFFEMLDRVYQTGEPFIGNEMLVKLDREGKGVLTDSYINFSYQAYQNLNNQTEGIFVFGTDVSDQVKTRNAIQESESRYRSVIEEATDAIFITDRNFRFLDINPYACSLFGYTKAELLNLSLKDIMPQEHDCLIEHQAKDGETIRVECKMKKKNGVAVFMEICKKEIDSKRLLIFGHDLTERIRAEKNNQFKAELLNTIGQAVVSTDLEGTVTFWNKAAEEIYGWSSTEAIGAKAVDLIIAFESKMQGEEVMKELIHGRSWSGEFQVQRRSGESFPTYVNATPLFDSDHHLSGIIGVSSDVSKQKKSVEELKLLSSRLLLATKGAGMGVWDWDIAHDLLLWDDRMHEIYNTADLTDTNVYEAWLGRIHPEDKERVNKDIQMALQGDKEYDTEFRIVWTDQSVHYIRASGIIEKDEQGIAYRMIGVNWDISLQKEREQQLKLLESVIVNTSDSVLITEAESLNGNAPRIVYVNEAFTRMTGYTAEDVIGNTPKILQGPKSQKDELDRLRNALRKWEPSETTLINYKKNGDEFWINFSLTPVANETGWFTHWIAIERDVTERKHEELEKKLLAEISTVFNDRSSIDQTLHQVLEKIASFGNFSMGEAWLVNADQKAIKMVAKLISTPVMQDFYQETSNIKKLEIGQGLPGRTWETRAVQCWQITDQEKDFLRRDAARKAGLSSFYSVPLIYNEEVVGVFLLGLKEVEKIQGNYLAFFKSLGTHTGIETKRKLLDEELNQIFSFAPDIICIIGWEGYFKKINPAACELFGYTEKELLEIPVIKLIHPGDRLKAADDFVQMKKGNTTFYFENRCLRKSGKIRWLAWTATVSLNEGLIFAVAKDITEKKELENLLNKANSLARIGSWEIDPAAQTIYWSAITREIHEAEPLFVPDIHSAIHFYKEGKDREVIVQFMTLAIEKGIPFDSELLIVTAKGNEKWVRVIGESENNEGKCIRVYGSFQDIDIRKRAELAVSEMLEEKNANLISIGELNASIQKHARELTVSNAELEQFAYVASHDLQEPLRMITSYLTQLEKKYGNTIDAKGQQYLFFAVDGAKRMRQIILDLLEYSRVGRVQDKVERIDINEILKEINILFRKQIEEKSASIESEKMPVVHSFISPIRQIFQNLISNALKYSRPGVPIQIKIMFSETEKYWQFGIQDNGIGIEKEYYEKIFVIFQRLHSKEEFSGTGLGLAITKKIVENLGGKIWVESEEGKGSVFYFTLLK